MGNTLTSDTPLAHPSRSQVFNKNENTGRESHSLTSISSRSDKYRHHNSASSVEMESFVPRFFVEHLIDHSDASETLVCLALRYGLHQHELHSANAAKMGCLTTDVDIFHMHTLYIPVDGAVDVRNSDHIKAQHALLAKRYCGRDISLLEQRKRNTAERKGGGDERKHIAENGTLMADGDGDNQTGAVEGGDVTYEDQFVYICDEYIELKDHYWTGSPTLGDPRYRRRIYFVNLEHVTSMKMGALRGNTCVGMAVFEERFCHTECRHTQGLFLMERGSHNMPVFSFVEDHERIIRLLEHLGNCIK